MLHLALFINQSRMPRGEVSLKRTVPCAFSSPNTNFVDREPFDLENLSAYGQKINNFAQDFFYKVSPLSPASFHVALPETFDLHVGYVHVYVGALNGLVQGETLQIDDPGGWFL
jgi:hypothetical protein